jgi:hypothetical protein
VLLRDNRLFPAATSAAWLESAWGSPPDEIDDGHTPALSRPKELAERLEAYAAQANLSSV